MRDFALMAVTLALMFEGERGRSGEIAILVVSINNEDVFHLHNKECELFSLECYIKFTPLATHAGLNQGQKQDLSKVPSEVS